MRFSKGYTYIVRRAGHNWYIVHQVSQRGWVATLFSHISNNISENERSFSANGVQLWEDMEIEEHYSFTLSEQSLMRRMMMSVLKYGDTSKYNEV
jgi:hypothetical protein